jgi:F-type H+-transporting ATPase subunit gamma
MQAIVADVSGRSGVQNHPFLAQRPIQNVEVLTLTPDRGLAGGLVTNLNRETLRLIRSQDHPTRVIAVGRKGRDFAVRTRQHLVSEFTGIGDYPSIVDVRPMAQQVLEDYQSGAVDVVFLVYTEFISTLRQRARSIQLLPVIPPEAEQQVSAPWNYEPDNPQEVLSALMPRYVEFSIYQALLEAKASEQSARMIAMSNATDNALELVKDLTLLANKARQAEITKEIAEISGAAEAIRTG